MNTVCKVCWNVLKHNNSDSQFSVCPAIEWVKWRGYFLWTHPRSWTNHPWLMWKLWTHHHWRIHILCYWDVPTSWRYSSMYAPVSLPSPLSPWYIIPSRERSTLYASMETLDWSTIVLFVVELSLIIPALVYSVLAISKVGTHSCLHFPFRWAFLQYFLISYFSRGCLIIISLRIYPHTVQFGIDVITRIFFKGATSTLAYAVSRHYLCCNVFCKIFCSNK